MSNIRQRLSRLEESARPASGCPGCTGLSPISTHQRYKIATGETVTLPALPERPPCTCDRQSKVASRKVHAIIVIRPTVMATREEAERHYAGYAAFNRPRRDQR